MRSPPKSTVANKCGVQPLAAEPSGTVPPEQPLSASTHHQPPPSGARRAAVKMLMHAEGQPLPKAVHEAFQDPEARRRFFSWLRAQGVEGERRLLAGFMQLNCRRATPAQREAVEARTRPLFAKGSALAEPIIVNKYGIGMSRAEAKELCAP